MGPDVGDVGMVQGIMEEIGLFGGYFHSKCVVSTVRISGKSQRILDNPSSNVAASLLNFERRLTNTRVLRCLLVFWSDSGVIKKSDQQYCAVSPFNVDCNFSGIVILGGWASGANSSNRHIHHAFLTYKRNVVDLSVQLHSSLRIPTSKIKTNAL